MRLIFAGTPEIAVPSLKKISEIQGWDILGVLSAPDKKSGRGNKINLSPVKELAMELNIPVWQPVKIDDLIMEQVKALNPDLLVAVAYGLLFPEKFLNLFPLGGVNLHPSLLPLFRGPSPISASILSGLPSGGISVQKLAKKMDAGDIILQKERPFTGEETTESLTKEFAQTGSDMVVEALKAIEAQKAVFTPQDHEKATYCKLLKKEDGLIDWEKPGEQIERMIRAYTPWPHGFTTFNGKGLVIHEAKWLKNEKNDASKPNGFVLGVDKSMGILVNKKEGVLVLKVLQLQAKKAMDFKAFFNGNKNIVGSILGE